MIEIRLAAFAFLRAMRLLRESISCAIMLVGFSGEYLLGHDFIFIRIVIKKKPI